MLVCEIDNWLLTIEVTLLQCFYSSEYLERERERERDKVSIEKEKDGERGREIWMKSFVKALLQGILKGEVSLYH